MNTSITSQKTGQFKYHNNKPWPYVNEGFDQTGYVEWYSQIWDRNFYETYVRPRIRRRSSNKATPFDLMEGHIVTQTLVEIFCSEDGWKKQYGMYPKKIFHQQYPNLYKDVCGNPRLEDLSPPHFGINDDYYITTNIYIKDGMSIVLPLYQDFEYTEKKRNNIIERRNEIYRKCIPNKINQILQQSTYHFIGVSMKNKKSYFYHSFASQYYKFKQIT